jgi:hypothetical protein
MSSSIAFAAIAEARSLDCADLEGAAERVDDQRRESFAVDVLGNYQKWLTWARDVLETSTTGSQKYISV